MFAYVVFSWGSFKLGGGSAGGKISQIRCIRRDVKGDNLSFKCEGERFDKNKLQNQGHPLRSNLETNYLWGVAFDGRWEIMRGYTVSWDREINTRDTPAMILYRD